MGPFFDEQRPKKWSKEQIVEMINNRSTITYTYATVLRAQMEALLRHLGLKMVRIPNPDTTSSFPHDPYYRIEPLCKECGQ